MLVPSRMVAAAAAVPATVLACLAWVPASVGAAPSCRGQQATIVGTPGVFTEGTEGDDVIVTNGSSSVHAGAGADLVCVTGDPAVRVYVEAGTGDDLVDTTAFSGRVGARLQAGSDTFRGGPGRDDVETGSREPDVFHPDPRDPAEDVDNVDTGAGADRVMTGNVAAAEIVPNSDVVRLGPGRDLLKTYGPQPGGDAPAPVLDGGAGRDEHAPIELQHWSDDSELVVDSKRGEARRAGVVVQRFSNFEKFVVRDMSAIGGPEPDYFEFGRSYSQTGFARTGGGNDVVVVDEHFAGTLAGGAGVDEVKVQGEGTSGAAEVNLAAGRGKLAGEPFTLRSFEHLDVREFGRVHVTGTARGDRVRVTIACRVVVDLGAGADTAVVRGGTGLGCPPKRVRSVIDGGRGDDMLSGWSGKDVLLGGPGRDRAHGGAGRDRCVAERRVACEA